MNLAIYFSLLLFLLPIYFLLSRKTSKKLPPGSLGIPVIGQSLNLLRAMHNNTAEEWLWGRIQKYGPISKMNILGKPTVFLHGTAANKFIYTCDGDTLANQQPPSVRGIIGQRNLLEMSGLDHKRIRGALVSFLRPEALKQYVGKMDREIREHFAKHWHGKQKISTMPLMKHLTFNVMTSLIFGLEEAKRNPLVKPFQQLMEGMLAVPINFPFTAFSRSLKAREKIRTKILDLIQERRAALDQQKTSPQQDLITTLLSLRNEDNSGVLSDEEIVDNIILIMIAGHDTTSILLTFLIRLLATDPSVYASVLQEQEEIGRSKRSSGDALTWEDIAKMKYTWRVAMETLRVTPPVMCSFRMVLQDFEYEGYLIPKGWQVIWAANMTHMDGRIFPEPSKFDPTRFEKQAVTPYSFMAFGGGPRICPGIEFARIETLVTIHYLVTHFTWSLCNPHISFSRSPLPTFKRGLEILIEPKVFRSLS